MRLLRFAPLVVLGVSLLRGSLALPAEGIRLTLSSPKPIVLLGEPLVLDLQVTNHSNNPVQAERIRAGGNTNLRIEAGASGKPRRVLRPVSISDQDSNYVQLAPGRSWCFRFRVGYSWEDNRTFLVMPEVGKYELAVRFPSPFLSVGMDKRYEPVSNSVIVDVREPRNRDAEVRKMLWHAEVIAAMTRGFSAGMPEETDRLVAAICDKALMFDPKGGYSEEVRRTMRDYYIGYPSEFTAMQPADQRTMRKRIGLPEPEKSLSPFSDDRRLDRRVIHFHPARTPWPKVFAELTKQSGVLLRVSPDLAEQWTMSLRQEKTLREIISQYGGYTGVRWVKDGDGYLLKRAAVIPSDPATLTPPYALCFDDSPAEAEVP